MTNESKIREILLKHNEWNCYDDKIEEGYGTVEYHTESLEKVVKDLSQLLTPSQDSSQHDSELLEGFAEYASRFDSTVFRSYLVKEYLNTLTPQSKEEK